jgi:ankyrin repeat protein
MQENIINNLVGKNEFQIFLQRHRLSLEEIKNKWGNPLIAAAELSDFAAAKFFLDNNIDVNSLFKSFTPLAHAVIKGDLNLVKLLVERGAYINSYHPENYLCPYPLFSAVLDQKNHEIVKFLLENGAAVNIKSLKIKDDINLYNYLKEQCNIPADQEVDFGTIGSRPELELNIRNLLTEALSWGPQGDYNIETVKLLISYGVDVHERQGSDTALHIAAKCNRRSAAILLLENGADILDLINPPLQSTYFETEKILTNLANALNEAKNNKSKVLLSNYLSPEQIKDKDLIISALKGQLIKSNDLLYISNTIDLIKQVSLETDIGMLLTQVANEKLIKLNQDLIKSEIPEKFSSLNQYIESLKIKYEDQDLLTSEVSPDVRVFSDCFNSNLNKFTLEANSLFNLTIIRLFDTVVNGEVSFDELISYVNNVHMKGVFYNAFKNCTLILTKEQMKVKNDLIKFWQEEELLNSTKTEQNDTLVVEDASAQDINADTTSAGTESNLFDSTM